MGIGRLSWITIDAYARRMGIADFDPFVKCMRAMDDVYIKHHSKSGEDEKFSREMFRGAFNSR